MWAWTSNLLKTHKQAVGVVLMGGFGGTLAYVYLFTGGERPDFSPSQLIISILFGMAAGFIGVYLLGNFTMPTIYRPLALALLCGFAWRAVFAMAEAYVRDIVQQQVAAVEDVEQVEAAANFLLTTNASATAYATNTGKVVSLLTRLPRIRDPQLQARAQAAVNRFLDRTATAPGTNEAARIQVIKEIGETARDLRLPEVQAHSVSALRIAPVTPNTPAFDLRSNALTNITSPPRARPK